VKVLNALGRRLPIKSPVITWGMFDGVHRGHQALIRTLTRWAKKINRPSLVITFNEHPRRVLLPASQPLFITSLAHRLILLDRLGVDYCLVLPFTKEFSRISAEEFITDFIGRKINPGGIVLTANTVFGRDRQGDVNLLRQLLKAPVKIVPPCYYSKNIISSTLIRRAIQSNCLKDAAAMLGRKTSILGTVVHGDQRGRELGFPTANLDPHHEILPPPGVYAGRAQIFNSHRRAFCALVNIGTRPTFHPTAKDVVVEVYLLDYHEARAHTLYGRDMEIEIVKYLRPERRFASSAALASQICRDIRRATGLK
jgi:riboflavin kinase/FMN adenylyltransferase